MPTARERFARWFAASGKSKAEIGRSLGCSGVYVGYLLSGARQPGLKIALGIEVLTADAEGGPITPTEWAKAEPLPATGSD